MQEDWADVDFNIMPMDLSPVTPEVVPMEEVHAVTLVCGPLSDEDKLIFDLFGEISDNDDDDDDYGYGIEGHPIIIPDDDNDEPDQEGHPIIIPDDDNDEPDQEEPSASTIEEEPAQTVPPASISPASTIEEEPDQTISPACSISDRIHGVLNTWRGN